MALIRTCYENYYKDHFETNKRDAEKIWSNLRNLIKIKKSNKSSKQIMLNINEKTTTDNKIIANNINEFFTSIAGKLTETILTPKSTFHSYLTKINENSFFINPILPPLKKLKTL